MDIDGKNYTVSQLRDWLKKLGLKCSGPKELLVQRLCEVPVEERGEMPVPEDADISEYEDTVDENTAIIKREMELLKREKKLLERENELLRQMTGTISRHDTTSALTAADQHQVPLSLLKDLIPPYTGDANFEFWVAQVRSVRDTYVLEENFLRALIASKLSDKALKWFYSGADFTTVGIEQLLTQMGEVFGSKENKLVLRRRFETLKWKAGESFAEYFNEKLTLSMGLQIDNAEIIDYVIEGIPDEILRTQAYLQCFTSKNQLLQAFSKVTLKQNVRPRQPQQDEIRCYNCNSLGHLASECKKPKREFGACYGCGSKEHRLNVCPQHKVDKAYIGTNEYKH